MARRIHISSSLSVSLLLHAHACQDRKGMPVFPEHPTTKVDEDILVLIGDQGEGDDFPWLGRR